MVRAGDVIENPVTGETMRFVLTGAETAGELLRIDMGVRPGGFVAAEHVHPHQEERFQIASGHVTLRVDGTERVCGPGDEITIPAGTPHIWWNSGDDELRVTLDFRPAGRFAAFITTFFAMAVAGKTNARGLPRDVLQLGVMLSEYRDVIYGTTPPWAVQRVLFAMIAPLGRMLGYRPDVPYSSSRQRFQPLHDQDPGHTSVAGRAGGRGVRRGAGLVEMDQNRPGTEERAQIGAQGAMVVHDPNASILDPHRALVQVVVDRIVGAPALLVVHPAAVRARCVEAREVGDQ